MTQDNSPIVGIDLGTTNSVVAAIIGGKPQVLNCDGMPSMPSIVGLNADNQLISGTVARNQLAAFPDRTIASIKRKMGTMDPVELGDQTYTPPEISAMILRRLRDVASQAFGQDVHRAVITVPAYFDENQRQATREAGDLAGLTVERIINEPTAATLVYHADSHDRRHIAVYDFGGGTFDVSIVRMEAGVTEVLASQGDTRLGGDDLDQALLDHVCDQFQEEHGIDLRAQPQSKFRLLQACERAKIQLSQLESTTIAEEFIAEKDGQPLNLQMTVERSTFDELIEPFVERTIECIGKALRDASMTIHQMDDLVLVGGSTRVPMVADRLRDQFLREPSRAVDPDLAVALGAAVQAAMLQGRSVGSVLVDVSTHTLGLEVCVGMSLDGPELEFEPIIHRNSPLPARYERAFSTMVDGQKRVEVHVLQGDHREVDRNASIGRFRMDLEGSDEKHRKLVIGFDLTLDGMLRVTAKQPASGRVEELTIDNALSQFAASDRERVQSRLTKMFDESNEINSSTSWDDEQDDSVKVIDIDSQVRIEAPHEPIPTRGGAVIEEAKDRYPKAYALLQKSEQLADRIEGDDAVELDSLRERINEAMRDGDTHEVEELAADLDDLLFYVQ
ncbi:Hsp70 family protein [Neorhodopirellula pilleata]|uniref:Chaperone protein DnaK n=1 Tax=Neorhodopirellula pilleata TaxID=2714738 RepID=A0A5C5ZGP3_9BACT|nr:Hsp70 family protein [Neorhodopirellula pilleata]TWT86041.1 Chaperone protein DnaK [Neorhodopirellula pilleata]